MKSSKIPNGLASIIIPCWNQLEFTRQCIAALTHHTRAPWELIVFNNGSTDATAGYLVGVQDAATVPVTVIANAANRGFPAAINQGLQVASGEYLVLLNNDVVVTDGWLDQLVALVKAKVAGRDHPSREIQNATDVEPDVSIDPEIGLVGPMSNYASPPQLVAEVPYRDLDEMHAFARRWRDEHRGQWFTVPKLSGFCLLIKRAVYDAIGGLDERFGLGFFDDDDLAERARRAGFACAVAHDLFVHHFGSRTFVGSGIDTGKLLDENAQRFAAKWGNRVARGQRVALQPWSGDSQSAADTQDRISRKGAKPAKKTLNTGSENERREETSTVNSLAPSRLCSRSDDPYSWTVSGGHGRRAKVTLTMIVRDEENNLPHCLGSVRGLFDEIVVVDTGSTDRTKEIALDFGARVFDFVWIDDFSAARNAALEHATGDYAFWLDADDVVEPGEQEKLRKLLDGLVAPDAGGACVLEDADGVAADSPSADVALGGTEIGPRDQSSADQALGCALTIPPGHSFADQALGCALTTPSGHSSADQALGCALTTPRGHSSADQALGCALTTPPGHSSADQALGCALTTPPGHSSADQALGCALTTPPDPPFARGGNLCTFSPIAGSPSPPGGLVAYVVRCACDPSPDGTGGETVVDHVRLFPLRPDVRWTYRVHEQIMPALRRAKIPVRWSECTVRHTGYTDVALRARKLQRDARILREDLKARANDPFVLFNLGSIAIEQKDWRGSLEYLKRSLARSAPTDSITCKLFALIARAHQMLGDSLSALRTCEEGLKYEPADAELWFRKGVVHRHRGESTDAESCWRRILTLQRPEQFRSVDLGIYGHLTRRNLAALAAERGDLDEVERLWRAVLVECPGDREALLKLQQLKPQSLAT